MKLAYSQAIWIKNRKESIAMNMDKELLHACGVADIGRKLERSLIQNGVVTFDGLLKCSLKDLQGLDDVIQWYLWHTKKQSVIDWNDLSRSA